MDLRGARRWVYRLEKTIRLLLSHCVCDCHHQRRGCHPQGRKTVPATTLTREIGGALFDPNRAQHAKLDVLAPRFRIGDETIGDVRPS